MSCYNHLTIEEWEYLMLSRERGESIRQIAKQLGRSRIPMSEETAHKVACYIADHYRKKQHRKFYPYEGDLYSSA